MFANNFYHIIIICLLTLYFLTPPPPPTDNDVIDDEVEVEVDESDDANNEDNEEMPPKTKPAAKAASTRVTDVTPSAARKPRIEKPFLLDVNDGFVVVYYTEDGLDYAEVEIIVNGVLPKNGYRFDVLPDGMAITWMRAFHRVCFTKDHLRATMGASYSLSNNRVTAYDNVTEEMKKAKVTPDASDLYWGEPQVVPLKSKCTGTPKITELRFATGETASRNGKTHKQFSTIYYCRVLLSEQRSSNTAAVNHQTVDLLDLPSSQSEQNSPPRRRSPRKRSHQEGSRYEVQDDDDDDEDGYGGGGGGRGGGGGGGRKQWAT